LKNYELFSTYLHDQVAKRKFSLDHLAGELNHATTGLLQSWLNGWSVPTIPALPELAKVLRVDSVEIVTGWLIQQEPSLEEELQSRVLEPAGLHFPRTTDLTVRASKPRPAMIDTSFGEGDDRE
jgi:hypothetical protein